MTHLIFISDISHIYNCIIADICLFSSYHNLFLVCRRISSPLYRAPCNEWTTLLTLSRTAGIFQRYDIDYVFTVYLSVLFRT